MPRGKFITFEGPEGSGKTTHIALLAERLRALGHEVVTTREPGGTRLAELIRSLVRDEETDAPTARAEVLLFLAARAQVVAKVIRPALERGAWVLCDRFADSTFAYQGYGRGLNVATLRMLNNFATDELVPQLTFLLDVPPEVSRSRLASRGVSDRIERAGEEFHRRLRDGFLAMAAAEPRRWRVVDTRGASEVVDEMIWTALKHIL